MSSLSGGKTYWRSLSQLASTPEFRQFVEREFPVAASEFPQGVSRRRWMQLMGASLAFGGLAGCRWQPEQIAPFAMRPENRIPGKPEAFATSVNVAGMPRHLLATSVDGRPIKLEGNPQHRGSEGATDAVTQAALLGLYDPDRSDGLRERMGRQDFIRDWQVFEQYWEARVGHLSPRAGEGLALLLEPGSSATVHMLLERVQRRLPRAAIYYDSPLRSDHAAAGSEIAFGRRLRSRLHLGQADVVASFDDDLFGFHPDAIRQARDFSHRRDPQGQMLRLYAIESQFTTTGAAADHRIAVRAQEIISMLAYLEHLLCEARGWQPAAIASDREQVARHERFLRVLASDLLDHPGRCLLTVGARQPAEVHALAFRLNFLLNDSATAAPGPLDLLPAWETDRPAADLRALAAELQKGRVETLIILGGNPCYDAPVDLNFAAALAKAPHTIRCGLYHDETSEHCRWHLPLAHDFESWGDVRGWDGSISVRQPLIDPLLGGRSVEEILQIVVDDRRPAREVVREAVSRAAGRSLSLQEWQGLLHDGFLAGSEEATVHVELRSFQVTLPPLPAAAPHRCEVVFLPGEGVLDGRFANNGWLQELPGCLTKLTWDNAAVMAPATASRLGLTHGQFARLTSAGRSLDIPVFLLPGQAPDSIGLALGYGRTASGQVAGSHRDDVPPVGFDVNSLRRWDQRDWIAEVEVTPLAQHYEFATTQDHHSIDTTGLEEIGQRVGDLVREGSLVEYREHPDFAQHTVHHNPLSSLWQEPSHEGHAWGMSIDLNKCIGCNACILACQAENNIPIVGKDQVARGREMHWIRVDRYFTGDVDQPQVATQPVACHHCENAPCEQVCPVAATVHSDEGLNDMVYNRCVGTRYCANNCPYKVRRFNFFDYNKRLEDANRELMQLVINPEVTVRSRGVMEKCTYCVQRIQQVKITAGNEQRPIADGEIQTACQQACPSRAIVFGDLNDPASAVASQHADPRAYGMLAELNVKPRTRYLARIRNPHPALSDASDQGHA